MRKLPTELKMQKLVIAPNAMKYIKHQLQAGLSDHNTRGAAARKENCEYCSQLKDLLQSFTEKGELSGDDLSRIGILLSH